MDDLSSNRRRNGRAVVVGFMAALGMMGTAMGMPMPAFMGVERVVIACRAFPDGVGAALDCRELADLARAFLADGLAARGRGGMPVVVVAPGDEALGDPAALVVTLYAVATAPTDGAAAAVAVEIRRPGQMSDGIPFFQTPPAVAAGRFDDIRSGIGHALRLSLGAGVLDPLGAAPRLR